MQLIAEGRLEEAYRVARSPNPICGHACGAPCEDACRRGKIDAPVAIRALKRFVTERYGPESLSPEALERVLRGETGGGSMTPMHGDRLLATAHSAPKGRRVAIVGAGPAGIACAHDLALRGYEVTVFEAMDAPGGMMRYGIPVYRLPREVIDRQVAEVEALGVEFRYGAPLTPDFGVREILAQGYAAVFLAVGATRGRDVPIENADADGVVKAIEYLLNVNRYRIEVGRKVVVIGGGLVAIDAARSAMRARLPETSLSTEDERAVQGGSIRVALDAAREAARRGALEVTVVSLESEREMPALRSEQGREELETAREEGVTFLQGWGPKGVMLAEGTASGIELVRCVRVFDDDGRFRPEFDETQHRALEADTVILTIGQAPDLSFLKPEDGIETTPAGTIKVDPIMLATSVPGVFAGGDSAFPPSLLITVAQHGKLAARPIDACLTGKQLAPAQMHVTIEELPTDTYRMPDRYEQLDRRIPATPLSRRTGVTEVEESFNSEQASEQAHRCLYCHVHPIYAGGKCILCNRCVDICPEHCLHFVSSDRVRDQLPIEPARSEAAVTSVFLYDEAKCIRCGLCAIRCPTSAITMERFQFDEHDA